MCGAVCASQCVLQCVHNTHSFSHNVVQCMHCSAGCSVRATHTLFVTHTLDKLVLSRSVVCACCSACVAVHVLQCVLQRVCCSACSSA
mmetsp:Transcript_59266/g.95847  ORF Transcript_59266/g.95847 Transcript_59266/m.95847 type:complete len:88 (-) Transcript_59266:175-438(-)